MDNDNNRLSLQNNKSNVFLAQQTEIGRFPDVKSIEKNESTDSKTNNLIGVGKWLPPISLLALGAVTILKHTDIISPVTSLVSSTAIGILGVVIPCGILTLTGNITRALLLKDDNILKVETDISSIKPSRNRSNNVRSLVLENSKQAFEWKKKLIENAQRRIILSGNYCGEESFNEVLSLMGEQMEEKEELQIVILSSPKFMSRENKMKIKILTKLYSNQFQLIETGDRWMTGEQGLKKITNHTKALVVDGTHFLLGGSGIEDRYAYFEGVGDVKKKKEEKATVLNFFLARGFRDMDFVFSGGEAGKELECELLKLAAIWERYNHVDQKDTVVTSLMGKNIEVHSPVSEEIIFEENSEETGCGDFEILCSGPEMSESPYEEKLVEQILHAKEHIYIDHMFFHPTQKLIDLLIKKVNQGVKLTIVTNGLVPFSPNGHKAFVPRSRYTVGKIASKVDEKMRGNIEHYEFGQGVINGPKNTTLHKKVIVIDDTVIAGSSNLGHKSTVTSSDHEINFLIKSKEVAQATIRVIEDDMYRITREVHIDEKGTVMKDEEERVVLVPLSNKIESPEKQYNFWNWLGDKRHKKLAWLIG